MPHTEKVGTRFVPREQSPHILHRKDVLNNEAGADNGVRTRPNGFNAVIWFVNYLYLDHIASAAPSNKFYAMQVGWVGFAQYALRAKKLPVVIEYLPSSVAAVLGVTRA